MIFVVNVTSLVSLSESAVFVLMLKGDSHWSFLS